MSPTQPPYYNSQAAMCEQFRTLIEKQASFPKCYQILLAMSCQE